MLGVKMKNKELFQTEHQVQLTWLNNQIVKIANTDEKCFLNIDSAQRAYKKMQENLIIGDSDIEHFMSVHLSEVGIKKLATTLRVHKARNGSNRLQVEITSSNKAKLDKLVKVSGKTKKEIINRLLISADINDFQTLKLD